MKTECVEITKQGELVARIALNPSDLETEELGHVIAQLRVVEDWIDEAKTELRNRLVAGHPCSTWHLEEVQGKRVIHDVPLAWGKLREAGVAEADLLAAVTLPITRAEALHASALAANEGAGKSESDAVFRREFEDCVRRQDPTGRLTRSL